MAVIIIVLLVFFFLLIAGMALGQMLYQLSEHDNEFNNPNQKDNGNN